MALHDVVDAIEKSHSKADCFSGLENIGMYQAE
jgi:hypothetical protein